MIDLPLRLRPVLNSPTAAAVLALGLRLAAMNAIHTYRFAPDHDYYAFGTEMGRIARSIVWGRGFSSPLHGPTGPTAMVGPVYPYLIAGVFRLFGVYTIAAAWTMLALNSLFSALTCLTVAAIGHRAFGRKTGTWAAWIWAVFPFAIYWPIAWVWDTSLSTLLFSAAFLAMLRTDATSRIVRWAGVGLLWGIVVLANTTFLSIFPLAMAWLCVRLHRAGRPWIVPAGIVTLSCLMTLTPWLVRNHMVFGHWVLRSNLGLELAQGNAGGAGEPRAWRLHPAFNETEMEKYRRQGELAYMAEKQREVFHFIATNPQTFAQLTLKKVAYFWAGTSEIRRIVRFPELLYSLTSLLAAAGLFFAIGARNATAPLFAATLIVFPLIYYVTHPDPRFRHLIEPEILVLATYAITRIPHRKPDDAMVPGSVRNTKPALS
jgi:4-amino-4-deoxy-L-arabinose transferase-like glycosyltransferase